MDSDIIRDRFKEFRDHIMFNRKLKEIRINIIEIEDNLLQDTFLDDIDKFMTEFRETIYKRLKDYSKEIENFFKEKYIIPEMINLIIDVDDISFKNRKIDDFSKNLIPQLNKYMIFYGRYITHKIEKQSVHLKVQYRCRDCGAEFWKKNNLRNEMELKPAFCTGIGKGKRCKNKQFDASDIVDKKSIEHGSFQLGDIDLDNFNYDLKCKIFRNMDYFIEKINTLSINENIKVIGILRTDDTFIFSRNKKDKLKDFKYIEVIDIITEKSFKVNKDVITLMRKKIQTNPSYRETLIDAVFPLTWLIDIFYQKKLALSLSYVSGGAWKSKYRFTINSIIGGGGGTYKSTTARNLCYIVKDKDFIVRETSKITKAGLIGTTLRNSDTNKIEIKHGLFPLYSNGTVVFDEAQDVPFWIINCTRCVEKGDCSAIQDASDVIFPAKESIILIQNFVLTKDGWFDHKEDLTDNLGWNKQNSESLLERYDLFVNIPFPDKYIRLWLNENERKESNGTLYKEIARLLEIEDYDTFFPIEVLNPKVSELEDIESKILESKIDYLLRNYYQYAKHLYRKTDIAEKYKDYIRNVYEEAIKSAFDKYHEDIMVNQRTKNTCYKVLCGLACLRLDDQVNDSDFEFFKRKLLPILIGFRDSKLFNLTKISEEDIFIESIKELKEKTLFPKISMKKLIEHMRFYIKRIYYNTIDFNLNTKESKELYDKIEKEIDQIIPNNHFSKGKNYKLRKFLKNSEENLLNLGLEEIVYKNKTLLVGKSEENIFERKDIEIIEFILSKIKEFYDYCNGKPIYLDGIIQNLNLEDKLKKLSKGVLKDYIQLLYDNGYLDKIDIVYNQEKST